MNFKINGNIIDISRQEIFPGEITIDQGKIKSVKKTSSNYNQYILPGLIDSHIHIESSMLTPQNFSRIAVSHGTVATVSDPHEIANVLGLEGIEFMINDALKAKLKFFFGAPSCVPATNFETSGGRITSEDIEYLFIKYKLLFLSEVMNFPDVIKKNKYVLDKIRVAKKYNKRIDGHAPGLTGEDLDMYFNEGIETDHECTNYDEAVEKIKKGMIIQVRQGSAAKNFDTLKELINIYPDRVMLCTDDLHPNDLINGHMDNIIKYGIKKRINIFKLLKAATINPVNHYKLNVGLLEDQDPADFIVINNPEKFDVLFTYINGECVYKKFLKPSRINYQEKPNKFVAEKIFPEQLKVPDIGKKVKVIHAHDNELITDWSSELLEAENGYLKENFERDILKIVVVNRYEIKSPSVAYIMNFGLKKGALATSISHDSHNIIAVGVNDEQICECINYIIENKGGIVVCNKKFIHGLPLPVAGIISDDSGEIVAENYRKLNLKVKEMGCSLVSPFMTLSFMSLLVIPKLKLSDKGLFDSEKFEFTSLYI